MPHACVQGRWIQDEFWIPLAEWWIETVLCTWEESVKVIHAVGRCLHVCLHFVVTPKTARAAISMNQVSHSDWHGNEEAQTAGNISFLFTTLRLIRNLAAVQSIIREAFSNTTRLVNGFFSWVVAALPRERSISK